MRIAATNMDHMESHIDTLDSIIGTLLFGSNHVMVPALFCDPLFW